MADTNSGQAGAEEPSPQIESEGVENEEDESDAKERRCVQFYPRPDLERSARIMLYILFILYSSLCERLLVVSLSDHDTALRSFPATTCWKRKTAKNSRR